MGRIIWKDHTTGQKAQFIADIMKESLFDYSFDSNRVPSLNLHYFCEDYIMTFELVEEGTMRIKMVTARDIPCDVIFQKQVWKICRLFYG